MALKNTIQSNFGLEIPNAYHRVGRIQIVNKSEMTFVVNTFVNDETAMPVETNSYSCVYDLSGDNALAQAYKHLKTLLDFAGANDC
jgi:hypothetical protein